MGRRYSGLRIQSDVIVGGRRETGRNTTDRLATGNFDGPEIAPSLDTSFSFLLVLYERERHVGFRRVDRVDVSFCDSARISNTNGVQ